MRGKIAALHDTIRRRRAVVLVICSFVLAACNGSKNAYVPPPPPKVTVAQPVQKPVTLYIELTGNTAPFNTVTLVARVQGYLESIDYADGASVTKGSQLFGIEQDQYKAQLDQAKATLASNKATEAFNRWEFDQQAKLFKQDSTAQATLEQWRSSADQASAAILNAQAAIDLANINLGYTRVLAPFDGTVTNHQVDLGSLVGVSGPTTLATIIQTDPLYVYFSVSEPQVLEIRRSTAEAGRPISSTDLSRIASIPVEIGLQDEEGYPHKGNLNYASPQLNSATGTLTARALFDNKDGALVPGMFVSVRLAGSDDELAVCEEISAEGLCFRSKRRFEENSRIDIAVPYADATANIFVPARVVRVEPTASAGLFRHGVEFLRVSAQASS